MKSTSETNQVRDRHQERLRQLEIQAMEERDQEGYLKQPQSDAESLAWEKEAAWPAE